MISRFIIFKKILSGLFLFLCLTPSFLSADLSEVQNIRGIERPETKIQDPALSFFSWILYAPRQLTDAVFYGAGKTAQTLSDKEFIRRVKDILYLYEDKLLWFPIAGYSSGFRPVYGGGLYYKDESFKSLFRGTAHDAHFWSLSLKNSYDYSFEKGVWKNSLLGLLETKDDRRFYGLGPDPRSDSRNTFLAQKDYGVYTEDRRKVQWSSGLFTPTENYGITYLGYYQRRGFTPHGHGTGEVSEIFDVEKIPGFNEPVKHLYNELALEADTRKNKKKISPGFKGEIYSGLAAGVGGHDSNLFRAGFNAAGFIPVIKKDRVIVPRLGVDLVENLNSTPIPFSEYPRSLPFRGVSAREFVKTDRVSIAPSLEYQWPLSHMLTGSLFFDTLFSGPRLSEPSWHHGIWAAGAGLQLQIKEHELGRLEIAGGSQGVQVSFTVGSPLKSNHRKDW